MRELAHETEYRGEEAIARLSRLHVAICGVGALGSNLACNLARIGFRNLIVVDNDRIESTNVGTTCYGRHDVGRQKVTVLASRMHSDVGIAPLCVAKRLTDKNLHFLRPANVVVDCFDNSESRQILFDWAQKPILHVGLHEDYAECIWNDQYTVPKPVDIPDQCDYPLARNIVMLAVAVASECLIEFPAHQRSFRITLRDRKITELV